MSFEEIYERLELVGKSGFVSSSRSDWRESVQLPERVLRLLKNAECPLSQLSALFCFGGKPLIFFYDNPQDEVALHKAIWNLNEIPVVIIGRKNTVSIYNGFAYEKELRMLKLLGDDGSLDDFSYFKIVTGQSWGKYSEQLASRGRVDYYLLKNIQYAQEKIQCANVSRNLANRLIGKIIFLRYLADRKVMLSFEGKKQILSNNDIIELLQDKGRLSLLFKTLQDGTTGFNGDLFRITYEELDSVPDEAFDVLVRLLRCDNLESGEYSLFDVYDFSILPVEFISNVYEKFIGKEVQERKGAYYTPLFLVDYIVEKTVAEHLKHVDISSCKILDPACGSGIFLVESLRRIVDHYIDHAKDEDLKGEIFQERLRKLAQENIFGIDSDESAVQVAAFSIYLTLLDYQNPADISNFKFPNLLNTNIICQDSFIETPFAGVEFDCIIGNPPWKRSSKEYDACGDEVIPEYQKYIKYLERAEECCIVNNKEIAQAFVVRTFDFLSPQTRCALVLTSKVLYNTQSKLFRSYLLNKVQIKSVLELSSVRHEVFSQSSDPSIAPACVLMYGQKLDNEDANNHLIEHTAIKPSLFFSLFKVFTVEKSDFQYVRQSLLEHNDYLWKILLYGTYLDFNFITRLRKLDKISDVIKQNGLIHGQGIICGKETNRSYDISCYCGKRKIDARDLHQYYVASSKNVWEELRAQRGRRPELFKAPLLLVKKSTNSNDYTSRAVVITDDAVYTDAITGIHSENIDLLRNMAGVLNSKFFSYYALMCMSSIATEREQAHNKEKFAIPYVGGEISSHVERIERYYRLLHLESIIYEDHKVKIEEERESIENCIAHELCFTKIEKALLDYGVTFSIPLSKGKRTKSLIRNTNADQIFLTQYARIFIERFKGQFGVGMYLNYEFTVDSSYVLLRFFVESEERVPIFKNGKFGDWEKLLLMMSSQNISDDLYLRKDIRGFEKNGFYIIKPSEKRLWHPAVAYVDVQEFADAMFEQGLEEE